MIRKIIHINTEKCNGCGICVNACHEGAIGLKDGKAVLLREDYCDGLGDCLPACPMDAITFTTREAAAYDHAAVQKHLENRHTQTQGKAAESHVGSGTETEHQHGTEHPQGEHHQGKKSHQGPEQSHGTASPCQGLASLFQATASPCQGAASPCQAWNTPHKTGVPCQAGEGQSAEAAKKSQTVSAAATEVDTARSQAVPTQLRTWPIQLKLLPVASPIFQDANILIAADCTAYAYGDFHCRFMKNRIPVIACPKLDTVDYSEKLEALFSGNSIQSVTVTRMEVPCCGGITYAVREALERVKESVGISIPLTVVTISTEGEILSTERDETAIKTQFPKPPAETKSRQNGNK